MGHYLANMSFCSCRQVAENHSFTGFQLSARVGLHVVLRWWVVVVVSPLSALMNFGADGRFDKWAKERDVGLRIGENHLAPPLFPEEREAHHPTKTYEC